MAMLIMDWRSGKLIAARDPPFARPQVVHEEVGEEEEDEEDEHTLHSHLPPVRQSTASSPPNVYTNSHSSPFADPNRYSGHSQVSASTHSAYTPAPQAAGRPSMDSYGAFSDPAPSGFGTSQYNQVANNYASAPLAISNVGGPPILPEPDLGGPMVSRTMQYADPYAAVRATIAGQQGPVSPTAVLAPPSYESYVGYR
jgi:hypothetical protein